MPSEIIGNSDDVVLLDPEDALLGLAWHENRPSARPLFSDWLGNQTELAKQRLVAEYRSKQLSQRHGRVFFSINYLAAKRDIVIYAERIYRDVSAYLETGVSPNSTSYHGSVGMDAKVIAFTRWQSWLRCLLVWQDIHEFCGRFMELFLLHEAEADIWFRFPGGTFDSLGTRMWWPALREDCVRFYFSARQVQNVSSFLDQTGTYVTSLGDLLSILFPQNGDRLKDLANRNRGSQVSLPPEVWPWKA